jgi:hypothetical protein
MRLLCFCVNSRRQMTRAQARGRQPSDRTRISRAARLSWSFPFLPLSLRKTPSRRRPHNPGLLGWFSQPSSWLST